MAEHSGTTSARLKAILPTRVVNRQIFRALLSLASAALLLRVMGMLNQIVVSSRYGAGPNMDAYFIASTLPLLLAQLLGSAIEGSVVPIYARVRSHKTSEYASRLFSTLLNLFILVTVVITVGMFLIRSKILLLSAPGSPPGVLGLAIDLAPFIFPAFVLTVVISYLESILNTEGQFGWPAYAGMLVPLTTAVLVLTAGKALGVVMLCVGTVAGLSLQLCVFAFRARRARLAYRLVLDLRIPELGEIIKIGWPVLIGALIGQAANLTDLIFASFLSPGSISALNYSIKLTSVFTGVIFTSVGRAALPYLSRQASMNDMKGFKETLRLYIWIIAGITTVLSLFVMAFAHPLVQILFQRGAFTADDTNHTASTLVGFAVGLTPVALGFIAFRAFSAIGKTWVLMQRALFTLVLNAILDYFFSRIWQSEGIALATSATYFCSMFLLFFALRHMIGDLHLFTPPTEVVDVLRRARRRSGPSRPVITPAGAFMFQTQQMGTGERSLFSLNRVPYKVQQHLTRLAVSVTVFVAGVVGVFLNSLSALKISLASVFILLLMRYEFVLLLIWVLFNGPNELPIFRGSNVLIGLTVPTLLLMTSIPIKHAIKRLPALGFLSAYLFWSALSIGISPLGLVPAMTAWVLRLDCLAVSLLALHVLNSKRRLMICIDVLLLLSVGIALYGIYGYFTKQNGIVDYSTSLFRIVSIFAAAPPFALFLSLVIPVALYRTFTLQGVKRIISWLVVCILLVTAGLTFARAAYISIPVSILFMAYFAPSREVRNALLGGMAAVAVLLILLVTIGNVPILDRFANQDITSLNGRTYLWQAILSNFDATQLLGNGIRASDVLLTNLRIGINGQGVIGTSPHNLFLGTLYENGVIGLLLFTSVLIALAVSLVAGIRKTTGEQRGLFVVALAVLISIVLQSIDSSDFWDQSISVYIWVIMVLPFARCWSQLKEPARNDEDFFYDDTEPRLKVVQKPG